MIKTAKKHPLLIYTREDSIPENPEIAENITKKGAEIFTYQVTQGRSNLHFLLDELSKRGIAHLLVEGGPKVLTSFLQEGLADEVMIYIAPRILGAQGCADITGPMAELTQAVGLNHVDTKRFGDDICLSGLTAKTL